MNPRIIKYAAEHISDTAAILLIFIITYLQYKYIGLYHDDYGYASLSYAINTHFDKVTFENILLYLHWHYLHLGGRVLYFFFVILAMQLGLSGFMFLQSVISATILFCAYKTFCLIHGTKKNGTKAIILLSLLSLYLLIRLSVLRDCAYWAMASSTYIWPLLPLSIGIYIAYSVVIHNGPKRKRTYASIALCFFMAGFSHEQIAISSLLFMPVFALFVLRKSTLQHKPLLASGFFPALAGFTILYSAPGNYVRIVSKHEPLPDLSEVITGFPEQTSYIFSSVFRDTFGIVLCLSLVLIALSYFKNKKIIARIVPFWAMALTSAAVLYIAPIKGSRMIYPTTFWLLASASIAIALWHCRYKKITTAATVILFLFSCHSYYINVFSGYYLNYPTVVLNDSNLKNAARLSPAPAAVTFYKLPSLKHATCMPYDRRPYIEPWIRNYYKLPADVKFEYKDSPYTMSAAP